MDTLKGKEILYLGGTSEATTSQLLQAAQGRRITRHPSILGEGDIRGTRGQFIQALENAVINTVRAARDLERKGYSNLPLDAGEYRQIGVGLVKAIHAIPGFEGQDILDKVARDFNQEAAPYMKCFEEMGAKAKEEEQAAKKVDGKGMARSGSESIGDFAGSHLYHGRGRRR